MTSHLLIRDIHDYFDHFSQLVHGHVQNNDWEQQFFLPSYIGNGTVTRMRIRPGMEIVISNMTLKQDLKLHVQEACRIFELNYSVSGEIYCSWNGKEHYTSEQTGNVCYLEDVQIYMEKKANIPIRSLEIRLCPDQLFRYLDDEDDRDKVETLLLRFKGSIDHYQVSPAIQRCVHDLIDCTYRGALRRLYLESKVMEFIALFGEEHIDKSFFWRRKFSLRPDDIDRLKEVRWLAVNHLEKPLSIRELARRTGLNEFKLKKGFRELFGMTVFEFVRKERMKKALWLMESKGMNVGETAISLGYSNVSNFTTAFRKQYGCNPSEYLKQIYQQAGIKGSVQDDINDKPNPSNT